MAVVLNRGIRDRATMAGIAPATGKDIAVIPDRRRQKSSGAVTTCAVIVGIAMVSIFPDH